ncbi:efflux RND transporter periplasmic adaptor subunit [Edaphobacter sp. HDX4]|uniref:efflux RND transporter periplasmic adaptor subunit n=1 Tax=Edaphobacter sp. HDX4 TaxID=2794064 RepID=UPI002FE69F2D
METTNEQKSLETTDEKSTPVDVAKRGSNRAAVISGFGFAILIAIVTFWGIHTRSVSGVALAKDTRAAAILSVDVVHPSLGTKSYEVVLPASVQGFTDSPVYARTSGYLEHWYTDIGTHVKKGQLLADIQTPELDQQVQQAQSDLATAQANYQLAQITAERWQKLLLKNAVSTQERDQASGDLNARRSALSAQEANVRRLQQLQGFEKIYAPFDGVITARNTDIGDLIQGGENTRPEELFHLSSVDRLRVFVPVPEIYQSALHSVRQVGLSSDAYPKERFIGTIARSSEAIDPLSRTLRVEVDIENPKILLLPGAYVFVHLPLSAASQSPTIPSNALLFRQEGLRVGVVRDGRVQLVPISIDHDYGDTVEVIAGLSPEDQVVLNPSDSLVSGTRVEINKNTQTGPAE